VLIAALLGSPAMQPPTFAVLDGTLFLVTASAQRPLPPLWLREKVREASARDPTTWQRLFDPHRLPADLSITSVAVAERHATVRFSDGFEGAFDAAHLEALTAPNDDLPPARQWTAADAPSLAFDWTSVAADDDAFHACLHQFLASGFAVLKSTPTERHSVLEVASRFGWVRETNFGRFFEVYSRALSNDLAYRAVPLSPHTDNPYRDPVPGIQLLHCLVNDTSGGLSTLVDGLAVCTRLRMEDPDGFALLTSVQVGFAFDDESACLRSAHPLVETDANGEPTGIHYSPRLDETPLLAPGTMLAFHAARQRLGELLSSPEFEIRFRLDPGEAMMFDNNRVLHGRTGYDPAEGFRHLQGCYIDRDGPGCHYRVLERRRRARAEAAA
jgi:gamma-butyrobetaine dioxygenase